MKDNFVFIGDSLVYGYGVKKFDCWVNKISLFSNSNIINKGVNGSTTTDMLIRFDDDVISFLPTKVFIMGGTNDLLCNRSINSIIENIKLMIIDLNAIDSTIIIGLPPDIIVEDAYNLFMESHTYDYCKNSLPLLRQELISLCKTYNCNYIDFYTLTNNNIDNNIYLDGVHLNPTGQELILKEFFKNIAMQYF